jgi:hypothetical protein
MIVHLQPLHITPLLPSQSLSGSGQKSNKHATQRRPTLRTLDRCSFVEYIHYHTTLPHRYALNSHQTKPAKLQVSICPIPSSCNLSAHPIHSSCNDLPASRFQNHGLHTLSAHTGARSGLVPLRPDLSDEDQPPSTALLNICTY